MTNLSRRTFLGTAITTTAIGAAGLGAADDTDGVYLYDDFTDGLDAWEVGASTSTLDDSTPFEVGLTSDHTLDGDVAAELEWDATVDHGAVWLTREVDVESGDSYIGTISLAAHSPTESFNKLSKLRVYAGFDEPEHLDDFPTQDETWHLNSPVTGLSEPLNQTEGWEEFEIHWETPTVESDTIYLAVGIQSTWETAITHAIDCVEVDLERQEPAPVANQSSWFSWNLW